MKYFIQYTAISILAMSGANLIASSFNCKNATDQWVQISLKQKGTNDICRKNSDITFTINPGKTIQKNITCCISQVDFVTTIDGKRIVQTKYPRCSYSCTVTIDAGDFHIVKGIQ